ncbi:MAG: metal-dependent hydrolase [Gemmatimonadota bacterium]|jgi:inner membrane protein
MDNLTHSLAGAALAAAGLRRTTPLATATLVVAANAPDVDAFVYFFRDEYYALAFRRGYTHGPLAMAMLPFVVAGVMLAWDRFVRRRRDPRAEPARPLPILLLALLGVLTHPALDWMNTYGIRLLAPFSMKWFYGDSLFIIDPWLWLLLGASTFVARERGARGIAGWLVLAAAASALMFTAPMVPDAARVAWVIGLAGVVLAYRVAGAPSEAPELATSAAAPEPVARRPLTISRWALALAVGYILAMVASDAAAARRVRDAAQAQGIGPIEGVMIAPVPANPFRGDVVVQTPSAYHFGAFDWFWRPSVRLDGDVIPRVPRDAVIDAAAATPRARDYLVWSRFPIFRVDTLPDGYRVRITDARYPDMGEAGGLGGVSVRLNSALEPMER